MDEVPGGSPVAEGGGVTLHYDFARIPPPEELHLDLKGLRAKTRRVEAF